MSNDDLPGFIEDEPKKPSKPAAPEPAKGFNPFADVPVNVDPLAAASAPAAPAAKPGTARTAKPAAAAPAAAPAKGFDAFADAASQPDGNDADVKPGKGLDLWACPHCGTKNKPARDTCRECGKKPTDPVIRAWHAHPLAKPAIGVGVVLIVVVLAMLLLGGNVRLVEADAANIDTKPRLGKPEGTTSQLGERTFTPKKRFGVCGRIIGTHTAGELTIYVLALGSDGKDEARVNEAGVDFSGPEPVVTPELKSVTVVAFGTLANAGKGQIVSLLGDQGTLDGHEGPVVRLDRVAPNF